MRHQTTRWEQAWSWPEDRLLVKRMTRYQRSVYLLATIAGEPRLAPMLPLFRNGQLAIVQAVGSPDPTRSHFDAQDFMESGTPGMKATDDGWLNRAMQSMPEPQAKRAAIAAVTVSSDREHAGKGLQSVEDEAAALLGSELAEATVEWLA